MTILLFEVIALNIRQIFIMPARCSKIVGANAAKKKVNQPSFPKEAIKKGKVTFAVNKKLDESEVNKLKMPKKRKSASIPHKEASIAKNQKQRKNDNVSEVAKGADSANSEDTDLAN